VNLIRTELKNIPEEVVTAIECHLGIVPVPVLPFHKKSPLISL
jgi:hypothetical protein